MSITSTPVGLGVYYNQGGPYRTGNEHMEDNTTAPPPHVPRIRPPSAASDRFAKQAWYFNGADYAHRQPATPPSNNHSPASLSQEYDYDVKSKLNTEDWPSQSSSARVSPAPIKSRKSKSHIKRVDSLERLRRSRSAQGGTDRPTSASSSHKLSRAEQIIEKTPPVPWVSPKHLYWNGVEVSERPVGYISASASPQRGRNSFKVDLNSTDSLVSKQDTPVRSPIGDSRSVPMRTSSLWAANKTPAAQRKRESKTILSSSIKTFKSDSNLNQSVLFPKRSPVIPDHKWADLGEDHETVKRIRELRERRKSRFLDKPNENNAEDISPTPESTPSTPLENPDPISLQKGGERGTPKRRQPALRSFTEPSNTHSNELKVRRESRTPSLVDIANSGGSFTSSRPQMDVNSLAEATLRNSPTKATKRESPTRPLGLDYSYSKAVDALDSFERRPKLGSIKRPSTATGSRDSMFSKSFDLSNAHRVSSFTATKSRLNPLNLDSPLNFQEKRNRRKSMSDVRYLRRSEDALAMSKRDSVESEVFEYLNDPRLSRTVRHPQTGRLICYSEVGDPKGAVLIVCVGMGLTRFVTAFYDEFATTLGLRLITIDRPGIGGSEPLPPNDGLGPMGWPEDLLAICRQLEIKEFSLLAHSAGAIYALATALALPNMVKGKIHLLAPWIPHSQFEIKSQAASTTPAASLPRSQRLLRILPTAFLRAANSPFVSANSASLKPATKRQINNAAKASYRSRDDSPSGRPLTRNGQSDRSTEQTMFMDQFSPDKNPMVSFPMRKKNSKRQSRQSVQEEVIKMSATASPNDPEFLYAGTALNAAEHSAREHKTAFTSRLTQQTWLLATRDSNPATDLIVCLERHREIGFRYTDVPREVIITHGTDDKRVPVGNARWLADQINLRALTGMAGQLLGAEPPPTRHGWADTQTAKIGCELRVLEGEGHGLMASVPVMSNVLTEIAGY